MADRKIVDIDRIPKVKYDEQKLINHIIKQRTFMMDDRQEWQNRQKKYLSQWDDYITYNRTGPWEESASIHLPITMQMVKSIHARFKQTIFSVRPWWMLVPLEKLDKERMKTIDTVMRWAVQNYINHDKGIELAVDDWIWDFVTIGWGVMKRRWEICSRKAIIIEDVQKNQEDIEESIDGLESLMQEDENPDQIEIVGKEVEKLLTYFDGPVVEPLPHEDILFPGSFMDVSDLNQPNMVCHDYEYDASTLKGLIESGYYERGATEDVIEKGMIEVGPTGNVTDNYGKDDFRRSQDSYHGVKTVDAMAGVKKAKLCECHMRYDIDGDGIDEELIVTICPEARKVVRLTYLDRVTKTGKRPFHKIDFIRRPRRAYSLGLLEMLYPINEEIDAVHNMRMDFGTLTNVPFFFFRSSSGMKPEKIRIEPGVGVPLDDPNNDVNFPKFQNSTAWGFQEEASLIQWAEKLTSSTAMNSGMPSERVGASRTASGMIALLNEGNMNLDVMLGRLKTGYSELLKGVLSDLQERMPEDLKVRVTGSDGRMEFGKAGEPIFIDPTREDIGGNLDLIISANSANSNRELEKQNAIMYSQLLLNPINIQTGIVQPNNIYHIMRNVVEKHGIQNIEDYLTMPETTQMPLGLYDEIAAVTQGLVPRIVMHDNHQAKVEGLSAFAKEPAFEEGIMNGVNSSNAPQALNIAIETHTRMMEAMNAQAQNSNVTGLQLSPTMGARMSGAVGGTGRPLPTENQQGGEQNQPPPEGQVNE
jgi:hypothetical protein